MENSKELPVIEGKKTSGIYGDKDQNAENYRGTLPDTTREFKFLEKAALELGASDARVISAGMIYVENRVILKCKSGCITYGTRLTCPPYVPTPDEFRKILAEYHYALLVQFTSTANTKPEVICSLYKNLLDKDANPQEKIAAASFMDAYVQGNTERLDVMLELEKIAFNSGFTFAIALVNGSCRLCDTCNLKTGRCLHPTRARIPEHAVGINMKKTAEQAGMPIKFPVVGNPHPMAILLID